MSQKGFTLIELIIVVAIIALLAVAVFVILDPARRFQESQNSRRMSDIKTVADAVLMHQADNKGVLASGIDSTLKMIGTALSGCDVACGVTGGAEITPSACLDLSTSLDGYLGDIPVDPLLGSETETYYGIKALAPSGIKVVACSPEDNENIEITR